MTLKAVYIRNILMLLFAWMVLFGCIILPKLSVTTFASLCCIFIVILLRAIYIQYHSIYQKTQEDRFLVFHLLALSSLITLTNLSYMLSYIYTALFVHKIATMMVSLAIGLVAIIFWVISGKFFIKACNKLLTCTVGPIESTRYLQIKLIISFVVLLLVNALTLWQSEIWGLLMFLFLIYMPIRACWISKKITADGDIEAASIDPTYDNNTGTTASENTDQTWQQPAPPTHSMVDANTPASETASMGSTYDNNTDTTISENTGQTGQQPTDTAHAMININTASKEALLSLPGIGIVETKMIMEKRAYNEFRSLRELIDYLDLSERKYKRLEAKVAFSIPSENDDTPTAFINHAASKARLID